MNNRTYALYGAWFLSCVAVVGSYYFSEVLSLEPCQLCWYQRIFLFPLPIILGIAVYRNFLAIVPYALSLAVLGFFVAVYQVALQEVPAWQVIGHCGAGPSCLNKIDIGLGPLSIPMLSAFTFALICSLLFYAGRGTKE
jgi:disulfide bond formation protein DsbB